MKRSLCILFAAALFLSGCSQQPKGEKLEQINIAFQDWEGYGLFYLARDKGFFRDEGIEVVFVEEPLDSARRDAFIQGMLDCEAGTVDLLVSKRAQGVPIVAVMVIDYSFGADGIVASKDIQKLEDLIGKRVALARDDVGETFLSALFYKKKLPFDKIVIVPEATDEVAQAFLTGEVDAVATWEPHIFEALGRMGSHVLVSSKDEPGIIIDTLNVREELVKKRPRAVKALMRGWFKALKYYREDPVGASKVISGYYGITDDQYRRDVQGLRWVDYTKQDNTAEMKNLLGVFNMIVDIKFKNGRISQKPDASDSIDGTLLKELYEDRK